MRLIPLSPYRPRASCASHCIDTAPCSPHTVQTTRLTPHTPYRPPASSPAPSPAHPCWTSHPTGVWSPADRETACEAGEPGEVRGYVSVGSLQRVNGLEAASTQMRRERSQKGWPFTVNDLSVTCNYEQECRMHCSECKGGQARRGTRHARDQACQARHGEGPGTARDQARRGTRHARPGTAKDQARRGTRHARGWGRQTTTS